MITLKKACNIGLEDSFMFMHLTVWRLTGLALLESNVVKLGNFLSNQILKGQTAAKSELKRWL